MPTIINQCIICIRCVFRQHFYDQKEDVYVVFHHVSSSHMSVKLLPWKLNLLLPQEANNVEYVYQ